MPRADDRDGRAGRGRTAFDRAQQTAAEEINANAGIGHPMFQT
nr:hypothetical protein OG781_43320 [Streptomyces sp. NBC_00830]